MWLFVLKASLLIQLGASPVDTDPSGDSQGGQSKTQPCSGLARKSHSKDLNTHRWGPKLRSSPQHQSEPNAHPYSALRPVDGMPASIHLGRPEPQALH